MQPAENFGGRQGRCQSPVTLDLNSDETPAEPAAVFPNACAPQRASHHLVRVAGFVEHRAPGRSWTRPGACAGSSPVARGRSSRRWPAHAQRRSRRGPTPGQPRSSVHRRNTAARIARAPRPSCSKVPNCTSTIGSPASNGGQRSTAPNGRCSSACLLRAAVAPSRRPPDPGPACRTWPARARPSP